ncbi:hypothetical protein SISSUDRAFT_1058938 [Sistotremastrum suecicum HHB10207 ss-3]|uniref:DUF4243 domain-containing protein n=1 Tax=Sistotremastrum suecicum HHB10207 ss-3 TaxID=1314776 RepID=A0A166GVZ6_9AGAM|nr:hypothetical protein SISSUDRAFT_1058938 [Sistotremastrum suecicum HHB10207 ss-3]
MSNDILNTLYPLPTVVTDRSPKPSPGFSLESAKELQKWLKTDSESWHAFFNEKGYHNHLTHHLYAAYSLGAPPSVIREAYHYHAKYQRKAFTSPADITDKNWKDHLGDENYYDAYLKFFYDAVKSLGISGALEKYVFSAEANWIASGNKPGPQMLSRIVAGLLHPMIHVGHGAEFGVPGTAAQGLGWTAIHPAAASVLLPKDFFVPPSPGALSSLFATLTLRSTAPAKDDLHSFSIVARMLKDAALDPTSDFKVTEGDEDADNIEATLQSSQGKIILNYASLWHIDPTVPGELDKKLEELSWLMVLIYSVLTAVPQMHFVTSSLFLPSIMHYLQPSSQSALLRAYFSITLAYWVNRGRPAIDIKGFFENNSIHHNPPGPQPSPTPDALGEDPLVPNPWLPLLQTTITHTDEHLLKCQRSVVHYATVYGDRESGYFGGTELDGADILDGSLFVRVAWLTANRLGWMREGQVAGSWDRVGFFDN